MTGRRPLSLRSRVAVAAAAGTVIVAVVVAGIVATVLTRREVSALDRRLDAVGTVVATRLSSGADPATLLDGARRGGLLQAGVGGLVVTVREPGQEPVTTSLTRRPPELPSGAGTVSLGPNRYRLRTESLADGGTVTLGLPANATERTVARVRGVTLLVTLLAALGAAGLGWLLAGPATRPLRELRARTAALPALPDPAARAALAGGAVLHSAETADLAAALDGLLGRVEQSGAERERALHAARDFAAAAAHELRTPLTAMRTDLDVLDAHPDLPADQRRQVLAQLRATQLRVEAALTALAQLAAGDLDAADRSPVEVTDLVAQAVATAARTAPDGVVVRSCLPEQDVWVTGSPSGLRLAVDNLLANALRHSGGSRVEAAVACEDHRVLVIVDDDGYGVPAEEREQVFGRFHRGRAARSAGSGLGLALVAQQARLHGGRSWLADSPLGGTRAVIELPRYG